MSITKETLMKVGIASLSFDDSLRTLAVSSFSAWRDFVRLSQKEKDEATASRETNWEGYASERGVERFIVEGTASPLSSGELFVELSKRAPQVVVSVGKTLDIQELKDIQSDEYEVVLRYERYNEAGSASYIDQGGLTFILAVSDGAFEQYHKGVWSPLKVTDEKYLVGGGMQLQVTTDNRVQALKYRVLHEGAMMLSCHVRFKGAALKSVEKRVVGYKSLSREFGETWRRATSKG